MKKNLRITIFISTLFLVALIYSISLFIDTVNYELHNSMKKTLHDMADQQQLSFERQIGYMTNELQNMAQTLTIIGVNESNILDFVFSKQEELNTETIYISDSSGRAFLSTREVLDVSESDFFKKSMNGETFASEPYISHATNTNVILVSCPIYVNGIADGVLAVEYDTEYLKSLLTTFTDERGLNLLINRDSEIMLSTNSFVISLDNFVNAEFEDGVTFDDVLNDFRAGNSGSLSYSIGGTKKLAEFRPVSLNDWILYFEISEESLTESAQNISSSMLFISIVIIGFSISALLYIVVSKNKNAHQLEKIAYYDELTGSPNLAKLKLHMSAFLNTNDNNTKKDMLGIVKFDIANFKAINEIYGFEIGNKVLCAVADTGRTVTDKNFIQARTGPDEFMFFSYGDHVTNLVKNTAHFESYFKSLVPELAEHNFYFRYGRYHIQNNNENINEIINKVTMAHSFAKNNNLKEVCDYNEQFTKKVLRETDIVNRMHKSLSNNEFKMFLQPKVEILTGKLSGAEALVRWIDSSGTIIYPDDFIPLFEQNGFIIELDNYMLKNACEILKSWMDRGIELIPISVNFSRLHLHNLNFVEEILALVKSYNVDPSLIDIELTETLVTDNEDMIKTVFAKLKDSGFKVSIDDFGSGYSSLGMLKNFKADTLKLDRSFFIELEDEDEYERGNLVVKSIIDLATKLGMYTIAEGIEYNTQIQFLNEIGCKAAQGYFYAKPLPVTEFEQFVEDKIK